MDGQPPVPELRSAPHGGGGLRPRNHVDLVWRAAQRHGRVSSTVMRKTRVRRGGRCTPPRWRWHHPPNMCTVGGRPGLLQVAAQTWTCSRLTALYVRSLNSGGFERTTLGGATSPDMLQQTSRLAGRTQNPPPRAAPAQSKRRRWTLQRDGNHSVVGRRRRATLRSGAPPSRRRLITEKDGIASIGPHVLEEGAARRHGSDRSCSAGPPCARAPWAGSKQAPEDET